MTPSGWFSFPARLGVLGVFGFLGFLGFLIVIGLALHNLPVTGMLQEGLARVAELGAMGPFFYAGLYFAGSVLLLPCFPLTIGAGFLFGFPQGFLIASLSSTIGAVGAFLVGRYFVRTWLTNRLAGDIRFCALDRAITREGWKIVVLARLATMFPYNLVNYAFGLSGIGLLPFVLATWIGRIPITALHTYVGSVSAALTIPSAIPPAMDGVVLAMRPDGAIFATPPDISRIEWGIYGLGWLATFAVTFFIARLAREALTERIAQNV